MNQILWANWGVGNFTAELTTGLFMGVAAYVGARLGLHERLRAWLHQPIHDRLDQMHERLAALEEQSK